MRALSGHGRQRLLLGAAAGLLVSCVTPLLAESREEWQQPSRVMADLALKPGDTIADVGCGEGYFTFRLAAAVGDKGKVLAVDINAAALKAVRERAEREKRANIEFILSEPTDTKLGKESVGAVFLCDVIHEVPEVYRAGLMRSIAAALKPGGLFYFIDYRKSRDVTFDPYERLIPHDDLVKYGTDAGLVLDAEFHYLKYQVFLRFRKPLSKEAAASGNASSVAFDVHDGYFVSNKFEPNAAASFVVINDQRTFDEVFGVAFVMNDKSHRLPPDAFKTKMAVGAIHRGKAVWEYKVENVTADGKTLIVRYTMQSTPSETAAFSCPLILSILKGDYATVQFVENGKEIKKVEMGQRDTFQIKYPKKDDAIKITTDAGKTAFSVTSASGIGGTTITRKAAHWPDQLVLRVYLRGLESLNIASGDLKLQASVSSTSGNTRLLVVWKDGKDGPPLDKNSPYWMEIQPRDAEGKPVKGLPEEGGYFEMVVPKALMTDAVTQLSLSWVDFFR